VCVYARTYVCVCVILLLMDLVWCFSVVYFSGCWERFRWFHVMLRGKTQLENGHYLLLKFSFSLLPHARTSEHVPTQQQSIKKKTHIILHCDTLPPLPLSLSLSLSHLIYYPVSPWIFSHYRHSLCQFTVDLVSSKTPSPVYIIPVQVVLYLLWSKLVLRKRCLLTNFRWTNWLFLCVSVTDVVL